MPKGRKRQNRKRIGRWTPQRLAVLDEFLQGGEHLSARDVYQRLREKEINLGIATVYRSLDFLIEIGLLRQYDFGSGEAKYELNDDEADQHHHMVCRVCGKVINYSKFVKRELSLVKDIKMELEKNYGFKINSHQFEFRGVCGVCGD